MKVLIQKAVLGLYTGLFAASNALHRRGRARVRDVDALRPGPHGILEEIPTTHTPAEVIGRIEAAFVPRNSVVTYRNDAEIVLFVGNGGGSLQFGGIVYANPEQMPLLVAARARDGRVKVIVDNDFGWNMFAGPARTAYLSLVKQAVAAAQETVHSALS